MHKISKMSLPSTSTESLREEVQAGPGKHQGKVVKTIKNHSSKMKSLSSKKSSIIGDAKVATNASTSSEAGGSKNSTNVDFKFAVPSVPKSKRRHRRKISSEEKDDASFKVRGEGSSRQASKESLPLPSVENINLVKPPPSKYNFIPEIANMGPEERMAALQKCMEGCQKKYASLQSRMKSLTKKRKRTKKREVEREKVKKAAEAAEEKNE